MIALSVRLHGGWEEAHGDLPRNVPSLPPSGKKNPASKVMSWFSGFIVMKSETNVLYYRLEMRFRHEEERERELF